MRDSRHTSRRATNTVTDSAPGPGPGLKSVSTEPTECAESGDATRARGAERGAEAIHGLRPDNSTRNARAALRSPGPPSPMPHARTPRTHTHCGRHTLAPIHSISAMTNPQVHRVTTVLPSASWIATHTLPHTTDCMAHSTVRCHSATAPQVENDRALAGAHRNDIQQTSSASSGILWILTASESPRSQSGVTRACPPGDSAGLRGRTGVVDEAAAAPSCCDSSA